MCRASALLALLLLACASHVGAQGGLAVSPVRLDLAPGARAVSMTIRNDGPVAKTLRVEALRWTQPANDDDYTAQADLIVNPVRFTLEPGAQQVVRAGFRGGAPHLPHEAAYRVYVEETPEADAPVPNQLRLLLRIGVPLFVAPPQPLDLAPRWSLQRDPEGTTSVRLNNPGNRRMRLSALTLADADGQSHALAQLAYVLAGEARHWPIPAAASGRLRVLAQTDRGEVDEPLAPP